MGSGVPIPSVIHTCPLVAVPGVHVDARGLGKRCGAAASCSRWAPFSRLASAHESVAAHFLLMLLLLMRLLLYKRRHITPDHANVVMGVYVHTICIHIVQMLYIYICIYTHTYRYMYICIHTYIHTFIHTYIPIYIYIYVYIYIYIYHTYKYIFPPPGSQCLACCWSTEVGVD